MRCHPEEGPSGRGRLPDAADVGVLQVADPAMQHLERVGRGGAAEVAALDQRRAQPALGRIEGHGGTEHAAADHDEVEDAVRQRLEITLHAEAQAGARAVAASFLVSTLTSLP